MTGKEMNPLAAKRRLRKLVRERLQAGPAAARTAWSLAICRHLSALPEWRRAADILAFLPLPDEPDIESLYGHCHAALHLPALADGTPRVRPFRHGQGFIAGYRGIREPATRELSRLDDIGLALVPGRAFTADGGRLGRGGGHYDRLLAALPADCLFVGVGFELQVLGGLPAADHDIPMHLVVTESGVRRCGGARAGSGAGGS